mmetsp:Transcript_123196/g.348112  ORF Transcript_123196/g.348112 Transcript_123196/m.348112 type:complete len:358 (-) Transcript_123196:701-1774(-)
MHRRSYGQTTPSLSRGSPAGSAGSIAPRNSSGPDHAANRVGASRELLPLRLRPAAPAALFVGDKGLVGPRRGEVPTPASPLAAAAFAWAPRALESSVGMREFRPLCAMGDDDGARHCLSTPIDGVCDEGFDDDKLGILDASHVGVSCCSNAEDGNMSFGRWPRAVRAPSSSTRTGTALAAPRSPSSSGSAAPMLFSSTGGASLDFTAATGGSSGCSVRFKSSSNCDGSSGGNACCEEPAWQLQRNTSSRSSAFALRSCTSSSHKFSFCFASSLASGDAISPRMRSIPSVSKLLELSASPLSAWSPRLLSRMTKGGPLSLELSKEFTLSATSQASSSTACSETNDLPPSSKGVKSLLR